jgi:hypothetical protein
MKGLKVIANNVFIQTSNLLRSGQIISGKIKLNYHMQNDGWL